MTALKKMPKKGLGPSVYISGTARSWRLKFGTHTIHMKLILHAKKEPILRWWVLGQVDLAWNDPEVNTKFFFFVTVQVKPKYYKKIKVTSHLPFVHSENTLFCSTKSSIFNKMRLL